MRKIVIFTFICLFLGLGNVDAFSVEKELRAPATGIVGSEIQISMYLTPEDVPLGISTVGGDLIFDDTKLEYVSVSNNTQTGLVFSHNEDIYRFSFLDFSGGASAIKSETLIYTFTFNVIASGNTDISFSSDSIAGDSAATNVPVTLTGASVNLTEPSSNADLSNITVGSFSLDPVFAPNITSYTVSVPYNTTNVNLQATKSDELASVTGTGNKVLTIGSNNSTIKVTAQNGDVKNYTVNIIREEDTRSKDNNLSFLSVNNHSLNPTFSSNTTTYNVTVLNEVTNLNVEAIANDPKSSVEVTGNTNFKVGSNTITIKVTAENTTVKNYTINVTRQDVVKDNDTKLGSLSVDGFTISPSFATDVLSYDLSVPFETTNLNINAVANSSTSKVAISSTNLSVGLNKITIVVTAENNDTATYSLNVTREEKVVDKNNNLISLEVEGFKITPTFIETTTNYSMLIPFGVNDLNIKAIASSSKATVEIIGNNNLQVGQNEISIKVTAEDLSVKTYTIIVTKEQEVITVLDSNTNLSSLVIENHEFFPSFNKDETVYTLNVENNVTELLINALTESDKSVVTITGNENLKEGINTIKITVTAEDNSVKNYIINVSRMQESETVVSPTLSSDNYLKSLEISNFKIDFDRNLNSYTLTVPFEVSSLDLNYILSSDKARAKITGNNDFLINKVSTVEITVEAEDLSVRVYTLNVTRSPLSSDNKLMDLKIDSRTVVGFNSDVTVYNVEVDETVDKISLEAIAFNDLASISGIGTFELNEGNNTFLINVEDENGFIRYYQINITRAMPEESSLMLFLLIGLSIVVLIISVFLILLFRRKSVTEISKTSEPTIDFKPEFNFGSKNDSGNQIEYQTTKNLLSSNDGKEVPFDPYDDVVTKEEIMHAINNKDTEMLKMLYETEMLNRKKEELKKEREEKWLD